jgi:hypothetical protein
MSKLNLAIILMVFIFSSGCKADIKQQTNQVQTTIEKSKTDDLKKSVISSERNDENTNDYVNAYYFHGNFRCRSCHLIETMTKDVIQNSFKNDLSSKILRFKVVNVEKAKNKHFIKDYALYSKAVVLTLIQDNKEMKYKNLDKVWSYLGNENIFKNYIESEVEVFLKENK